MSTPYLATVSLRLYAEDSSGNCLQTVEEYASSNNFLVQSASARGALGPAVLRLALQFLDKLDTPAKRAGARVATRKFGTVLALCIKAGVLDGWPSAVADLVSSATSADAVDLACRTLLVLDEEIAATHLTRPGDEKPLNDRVKDALRDSPQGMPLIARFLLEAVSTHGRSSPFTAVRALEVLAAYVHWGDLSIVVNSSMMQLLRQLLTIPQAELRTAAVQVLAAAVDKGKPPQEQVHALAAMDIVGSLSSLALGNGADDMEEADFNEAVAGLLCSAGRKLLEAGDSAAVLGTPQLKASCAAQLQGALALALKLFETAAFGNACAVALVDFWDAVIAFWRSSCRGEPVPKRHGSGEGKAGCNGLPAGVALGEWVERLLPVAGTRSRYPDDFDPLDMDMDEEGEALVKLRHSAKGLLTAVTAVQPSVTLSLLMRMVGGTPPAAPAGGSPSKETAAALSRPEAGAPGHMLQLSQLPAGDAQLVLWMMWLWGEGVAKGASTVIRAPPVPWILTCLHEGALAGGGHPAAAVQLAYLDLATRYSWVLFTQGRAGTLLPRVLGHILGRGGLASEHPSVRALSTHTALRIVRSLAKEGGQGALAPLVDDIICMLAPYLKFAYRPPGGGMAGGVNTAVNLGCTDQQLLFELIGVLLAQPWVPTAAAASAVVQVITPLLDDAAKGQQLAQGAVSQLAQGGHAAGGAGGPLMTDDEADGGTGVGAWMEHCMGCIGRALKGFSAPLPGLEGVLDRSLTLAWGAPRLLPDHLGLRGKAVFLTRRMIPLLGKQLLAVLPQGLAVLLDCRRAAALADGAVLLQRCLEAYGDDFLPLLRSTLPSFVAHTWAAMQPALKTAEASAAADAAGSSQRIVRSDAAAEGVSLYTAYLTLLRRMATLKFGLDALWAADGGGQGSHNDMSTVRDILSTTSTVALTTLQDPTTARTAVGFFKEAVCAWLPQHQFAAARCQGGAGGGTKKPLLLDMQDSGDASSVGGDSSAGAPPDRDATPLNDELRGELVRILRDQWLPLSVRVLLRPDWPLGDGAVMALAGDVAAFHMECADRLGLSSSDPAAGAAGVALCQLLASSTLPALGVSSDLASAYSQRVYEGAQSSEPTAHKEVGKALLQVVTLLRGG